jgi:hypothetical protein
MNGKILALAAMLAVSAAVYGAESLKPADFAYGRELNVGEGREGVYAFTLPADVYRHLARSDAGDLRVFNSAGASVPFTLRRPRAEASIMRVTVPYFPIYSASGRVPERMSIRVEKDAHGSITTVTTRDGSSDTRRLAAYLLDTTALTRPVRALEFDWTKAPRSFLGHVTVEASDDLARWSPIAVKASIADLAYNGERVEHRRIELPGRVAKYLRLTWPDREPMPTITAVHADLEGDVAEQRVWVRLDVEPAHGPPGEYEFVFPGRLPADRARIVLPQSNAVVRVALAARDNARDPWHPRASGLAYRLNLSGAMFEHSELAVFAPAGEQYWRLQVAPPDVFAAGLPLLELGVVPSQLVFVAQGPGPYTLAYGASDVDPVSFPLDGVLADLDRSRSMPIASVQSVGTEVLLGGGAKLEAQPSWPWKQRVLWAVLLMAVALLAFMARRLYVQMGAESDR